MVVAPPKPRHARGLNGVGRPSQGGYVRGYVRAERVAFKAECVSFGATPIRIRRRRQGFRFIIPALHVRGTDGTEISNFLARVRGA